MKLITCRLTINESNCFYYSALYDEKQYTQIHIVAALKKRFKTSFVINVVYCDNVDENLLDKKTLLKSDIKVFKGEIQQ